MPGGDSPFRKGFGGGCGFAIGILAAVVLIPIAVMGGCTLLIGGCLTIPAARDAARDAADRARREEERRASPTTEREVEDPVAQEVPEYEVVKTEDLSIGHAAVRLEFRVSLPQHYSQDAVEQVAEAIVADATRSQAVNAISIFFYGPGTYTDGAFDIARVVWAPHGEWSDAMSVQAGDYDTFSYSVSYKPASEIHALPDSSLAPSGRTGLLGAPLPEGAELVEHDSGDHEAGQDPSEQYAISASVEDIASFFLEAMLAAGWRKDGNSAIGWLIFCKDDLVLGVHIPEDGNRFRLWGSRNFSEVEFAEDYRTWADASGSFSVGARFVEYVSEDQIVRLERWYDGRIIEIPVSRLSRRDHQWLRSHLRATEAPN